MVVTKVREYLRADLLVSFTRNELELDYSVRYGLAALM